MQLREISVYTLRGINLEIFKKAIVFECATCMCDKTQTYTLLVTMRAFEQLKKAVSSDLDSARYISQEHLWIAVISVRVF